MARYELTGFGTLKLARHLRERAGFTPESAEATAEAVAEAFVDALNGADLVSRAYLDARLSDLRAELKGDMAELRAEVKTEIAELRAEVKTEIAELRAEMKAEIAELRAEMKAEIAGLRTEMTAEIGALRTEVAETKAELLKWVVGLVLAAVLINAGVVVGTMLTLVRVLEH
ncbi:coiled-coil domain-containing protein [Pararhodospirillum photometricum]|uniref:DUF1640 domain-containing protein n=1 Tax=Pararhodospirillum photometricum DSM 122 TaxID=1150469 RepID=H6SPW2_PARPM|nr:coiled-coil domain-containing protein [Pararhodospirillum photometricum]CCG07232.1 Putative uncharacterized protein [Pararhodospirillum photometricum DSM 122]